MRRATAVVLRTATIVSLGFFMASTAAISAGASSNDPLSAAAAAINHGQLQYADPNTPGYSVDSLSNITSPESPIVLVEVPATATAETGGSGAQFANALNSLTHDCCIIAVAFVSGPSDNPTATFATATSRLVPSHSGAASDVMHNAIGQGPEDILGTFGRDMQLWLQDYPGSLLPLHAASASGTGQPAPKHHSGAGSALIVILLVAAAMVVFLAVMTPRFMRRRRLSEVIESPLGDETRDPPGVIPDLLRQIEAFIPLIDDGNVQGTLREICHRTRRFFIVLDDSLPDDTEEDQRIKREKMAEAERQTVHRLGMLIKVAGREGYLSMQNHPDEWRGNTDARLEATAQSLAGYNNSLETAIQDAHEGDLAEFEVNTAALADNVF